MTTLPGPLVEADWLAGHLGSDDLAVADVRWHPDGSGRAAFEAGHIPTATFVDVDTDLSRRPGRNEGRHPLPTPEEFAAAMERAGIGDGTAVVAYDDVRGSTAARLWWMLRVLDHPAAVLDGGYESWAGEVETGPGPGRPGSPRRFTPNPWPEGAIADGTEVDHLRLDPQGLVLDARAADRYRGDIEPLDPVAGHIPGAVSAPWEGNLDSGTGRFRTPAELRERYSALGAGGRRTVLQCGSGVTACHGILSMEVAGLPPPKLYVGSWSGWIADPEHPVARGPEPG